VREGLYKAMRQAFSDADIPWDSCRNEDRGDGVLVLAPVVLKYPSLLVSTRYNST
jgi:hypothetical protein